MPTRESLSVKQLTLDLANFRMMPQKSEIASIRAMISINPEWFWSLTESLLDDGYHPTENILVIEDGGSPKKLIVKEGNRRVGALKLILGYVRRNSLSIPSHIESRIAEIAEDWKDENKQVPCAVYKKSEAAKVDRIVTLTHGKGEKAGRDKWQAIARSRHNRDATGASEPALDLLEKYIKHGQNITAERKQRWSGDYPLTVLEEVMKRLAKRLGLAAAREFSEKYPGKIGHRSAIERMLLDIGRQQLGFKEIRDASKDFAVGYGFPAAAKQGTTASGNTTSSQSADGANTAGTTTGSRKDAEHSESSRSTKTRAASMNDPRAVKRQIRAFIPLGEGRGKLVALLDEARKLKLKDNPYAFCFLLRSMFEISAKAYCKDHAAAGGPATTKKGGRDRQLVEILRDVTTHLTKSKSDKQVTKKLHGAMAELAKPEGFLSVTSFNQLIHNPTFSVNERHICSLFGNIFPLLEAMNQ